MILKPRALRLSGGGATAHVAVQIKSTGRLSRHGRRCKIQGDRLVKTDAAICHFKLIVDSRSSPSRRIDKIKRVRQLGRRMQLVSSSRGESALNSHLFSPRAESSSHLAATDGVQLRLWRGRRRGKEKFPTVHAPLSHKRRMKFSCADTENENQANCFSTLDQKKTPGGSGLRWK